MSQHYLLSVFGYDMIYCFTKVMSDYNVGSIKQNQCIQGAN